MAYIAFNDGTDATLRSSAAAPGDRLANWIPANYRPLNDGAPTVANEQRYTFEPLGQRFGAAFELRGIGMGTLADSALDVAVRLITHLLNGGTCEVHTEDALDASYTNCGLAPDSTPVLTQADPVQLEYTLALALLNLDGDPMTCHYAA